MYTHKALILRRKYHSQVTLHHDPNVQLSRRHKHRIASVVASSVGEGREQADDERRSLDSLSHLIRFRRASNTDSERSNQSQSNSAAATTAAAANKRRQLTSTPNVVLKRHVQFGDDFTSVARVHSPMTEISLDEPHELHDESNGSSTTGV